MKKLFTNDKFFLPIVSENANDDYDHPALADTRTDGHVVKQLSLFCSP